MKALMIASVLVTSSAFAQNIDLAALKGLMTARQAGLESVAAGMSKRLTTLSAIELENGQKCGFKQVADQTVLKVQADKVLVYSRQRFMPANSPSCLSNGYRPFEEKVLFYEDRPSVETEIADMEKAGVSSVQRTGERITVITRAEEGDTIFEYDLLRPLFKNMLSTTVPGLSITGSELADISPARIDLTKVQFCEMEDGEVSDCVEGDYSDILFE